VDAHLVLLDHYLNELAGLLREPLGRLPTEFVDVVVRSTEAFGYRDEAVNRPVEVALFGDEFTLLETG